MVISGIIRPPQEIRVVADKTASMVAKNGRGFEEKILKSARGQTPKFAFLQPTSPFHAYYEHQVQLCLSGGKEEEETKSTTVVDKENKDTSPSDSKPAAAVAKGTKGAAVRKQSSRKQASAIDPIARALLQQRNKVAQSSTSNEKETTTNDPQQQQQTQLQPPPPLNLLGLVAPDFAPAQLELCQLAAQMTAIQPAFLPMLTSREWGNPQFAFLQPRHAHFAYFSSLVDTYKHLLSTYKDSANTSNSTVPQQEISLQQVLDQAAYRAEYDRFMSSNAIEEGEVVAIDWHDFVVVETIDFAPDETVELSLLPPPPSSTITTTTTTTSAAVGGADDDDDGEVIRVVPSYKPKVVSTTLATRAVDPITGASVSVADSSEHMRIQLLDPAWAKERQIFQDKQKDSNLVSGDAMVQNLSRLTQQDDAAKSKRPLELPKPTNQVAVAGAPPMQGMAAQFDQGPMAKRPRTDGPGMGAASIPPPPPPPPMMQQQQQQHVPSAPPGMIPSPPPPGMVPPGMDPYASQGMMGMAAATDPVSAAAPVAPEIPVSKDPLPPIVTLQIRIPNDPTQMAWNFYGQILPLQMPVQSSVKQVKSELSQKHLNGMPVNKIQFKDAQSGFLKDTRTLDDILTSSSATWELVPKTRGGRR